MELDYKTVKKEVWSKLVKIYGGGPSIVREKPYIYSVPIEENLVAIPHIRSPSCSSPMNAPRFKKEKTQFAESSLKRLKSDAVNQQLSKKALDKLPS